MVRTLLRSLREHKKGSILTILLSIMEVVFEKIFFCIRVLENLKSGLLFAKIVSVTKDLGA